MGVRKLWFSAVLTVVSVAYISYGAFFLVPALATGWTGQRFRLIPRLTSSEGQAPQLLAAGLLRDGCELTFANTTEDPTGTLVISFLDTKEANGWWFDIDPAATWDSADGPVRLDVEVATEGGAWSLIEYPLWTTLSGVSSYGSERTWVDLRPPWQWQLRYYIVIIQGILQVRAYLCDTYVVIDEGPRSSHCLLALRQSQLVVR